MTVGVSLKAGWSAGREDDKVGGLKFTLGAC